MSDECPGEGRCHGCMNWCPWCDDVANVCDFGQCDVHPRLDELKEAESRLVSEVLSRREETRVMERDIHILRERIRAAKKAGSRLSPRPAGWRLR